MEAAPWVIEKVKSLEAELKIAKAFHRVAVSERDAAYSDLPKLSGKVPCVFNRAVWEVELEKFAKEIDEEIAHQIEEDKCEESIERMRGIYSSNAKDSHE